MAETDGVEVANLEAATALRRERDLWRAAAERHQEARLNAERRYEAEHERRLAAEQLLGAAALRLAGLATTPAEDAERAAAQTLREHRDATLKYVETQARAKTVEEAQNG